MAYGQIDPARLNGDALTRWYLYGSGLYKRGELGIYGEFGAGLSIPATKEFLDIAPYPF